jgi:hypothetical protein
MNKTEIIKNIDQLDKFLKKEFIGIEPCKNFHPDCPSCRANIIRGYLEWLKDILE